MPTTINRAYKYAIFPNKQQQQVIKDSCDAARFIYNWLLDLRNYEQARVDGFAWEPKRNKRGRIMRSKSGKMLWTKVPFVSDPTREEQLTWFRTYENKNGVTRVSFSPMTVSKAISQIKDTCVNADGEKWLRKADSRALIYAARNCHAAYQRFFTHQNGHPTFKSRQAPRQSYQTFSGSQPAVDYEHKRIKLPKMGWVKFDAHIPFEGHVQTGTVTMCSNGKFYLSIQCCDVPYTPIKQGTDEIGINQGITHRLVTSDGQLFDDTPPLRAALKKRARLQRRLSRKQGSVRGQTKSKGFERAKQQLARLDAHIANIRREQNIAIARDLVERAHTIHAIKPNIQQLQKKAKQENAKTAHGKLTRQLTDTGAYQLYSILQYKCEWNDRLFIEAPSGQPYNGVCSVCGHTQTWDKSSRTFTCDACGAVIDIDINAAKNILAAAPIAD